MFVKKEPLTIFWYAVRLNSHGRHVIVYFAVYPTLIFAFRVAKWTATCSRLLRQDCGRLLLSQLRMKFEEVLFWPSSCSWAHATATPRSSNGNGAFSSCVSWHRLLGSVFFVLLLLLLFFFFFADDTGVNRRQTLIPTALPWVAFVWVAYCNYV